MWFVVVLGTAAATVAQGSAAGAQDAPPWQDWQSKLAADHPLTGKIWSTDDDQFVTPEQLAEAVAEPSFVLIGEIHDNPDHHRLQAWLIDKIGARRKPAVVMEMIAKDKAPALEAYLDDPDATPEGLGAALDWESSGWPDWRLYQPIAEAAWRAGLTIAAGNPTRAETRAFADRGIAGLEETDRTGLGLDQSFETSLGEALGLEIKGSHCGLLPEAAIGPMAEVQRYRDATLAAMLVAADRGDGAILIAGNGHVRSDRAVPWYLRRGNGDVSVSIVMLVEVAQGADAPADLAPTDPDGGPVADFIWFTPGVDRGDPCERLRERFKN